MEISTEESNSEMAVSGLPADIDLTLLSNFVHQVVNPLNGVAGTLDNLADGIIKEEHRREQRLRAARAQLEQCITLIRNLAFLAQGAGGVAEQDNREIVLPQVIIESAMFYQEDGKSKRIEIALTDRVTQNKVRGHPELIRQVLMNIFDNCIKYGERGSTIKVEQWIQAGTQDAIIKISHTTQYPISSSDIARIGQLGFRGVNAKKSVASGTGLGMYICKKIVEGDHGGSLHVQADGLNRIEFLIKLPDGQIPASGKTRK
jgi:signal transduction histidine kinase